MGSHSHKNKKKNESDTSSSESDSSSSSDSRKKKRHTKKSSKYSSSEGSNDEKYSKTKKREPSRSLNDGVDRSKRRKKAEEIEEHTYKERDKYKEDKNRENRYRENKYKDRSYDRSRDKEVDKDRKNSNTKDRYESRERDNTHRDNRRVDRTYSDQGNSRESRGEGSKANYRDRRDARHKNYRGRSRSFDHVNAKWGKDNLKSDKKAVQQKDKPNFGLSGKLTEETNTYKGIVIKYSEPPEARKPRRRWRLYPFKGEKALQTLYIHRESAYLIGRERKVVDLPVDHPSCSKQHAVLQYRLVPFTREDGTAGKRVRPYLIDLESANGTFINNKKIEPKKYVELLEKDVIKFGFSSREYVLLHENSKDEVMDDDVKQEDEEVLVKEEPQ